MRDIQFSFTIPYSDFVLGTLLLIFAVVAYLAISKNWEWLQNRPNPLPWMAEHYVALLLPLGFIAISLAIYFWIWDIRGEIGRLVTLLSSQTTPEDIRNLAYAIAALLGAVALSATIPFQLIKVWVNERLAKTSEQGHMTDRITKAVEQLGATKQIAKVYDTYEGTLEGFKMTVGHDMREQASERYYSAQETVPNLEVRIGAIYALERIARDSIRDHISIMEILCAYVRNNSPASNKKETVSIDIQAALTVIGRRSSIQKRIEAATKNSARTKRFKLDLRETNLQNVDLSMLDFSYCRFMHANLTGANLRRTKLYSSNLRNSLLYGVDLIESDLRWANLCWTKFDISANLNESKLDFAAVQGANFEDVDSLFQKQIESMFGDYSTVLPYESQKPSWANDPPHFFEFAKAWQAAKAAANL